MHPMQFFVVYGGTVSLESPKLSPVMGYFRALAVPSSAEPGTEGSKASVWAAGLSNN